MEYRTTVTVAASAERVWATLAALREWPTWTPTVVALDSEVEEPAVGEQVTIRQPRRRPARYVVDRVDPGRRFRWGSRRLGVTQSADHVVVPRTPDSCVVELAFAMSGPVGGLLGRLGAARIREMVDTEAQSLRRHVTGRD